ncbi:histone acetyltransferase 1 [Apophysomyces sp. BC1034]|nr:histone acetyltransferase 1 [Apophysomyces sp. BC1015]KAG0183510.1 histone acetyltransferase 1 [Apophysomyces sp. BC1021]KAG0194488.1 histone acetyltransferase 1 [Apophysomyces sp. BC1034]
MESGLTSKLAKWVCNTTESTELRLVQPQLGENSASEPTLYTTYKPTFTYPIFGEHEAVFGYQGLSIKIHHSAGSLQPFFSVSYLSQYEPEADDKQVEADDVEAKLKESVEGYITNYDEFIRIVREDPEKFRPIGEKVNEYSWEGENGDEEHFEIYKSSFANPKFVEYHKRMRFFMFLFVEGTSLIDVSDEKWEIYTLFKREGRGESASYRFMGYTSAYAFYCYPENTRMRISQFLILPPFQDQGHGSKLYRTVFDIFAARKDVIEITVEDPNQEFSDLRDKCDMRYLLEHHAFDDLPPVPVQRSDIRKIKKKFKLTDRQTQQCVEMYLLSKLNKMDATEYKNYRLQVKRRLYMPYVDAMKDLSPEDRKEKLHNAYKGVEEDYHRILEII